MLKTSGSTMASPKNPDTKRKQKDGVINNLKDLFGNILHIDIIRSVASECDFDVQRSSNVLLEMTNNIDEQPKKKAPLKKKSPQHTPSRKLDLPLRTQPAVVKSRKTLEVERVINSIKHGYKVLIILRGLPGSGKSRMAVALTDITLGPGNNCHHILSTDDFFIQHKGYVFDSKRLQDAHEWNHRRAFQAMSKGVSPVVIDNTNTQMWEMKPYAMMATDYGYTIEILEPDTWWAFNDKELARRNSHNVPRQKIKDMLDRYEKNVTAQKLLCAYNLAYKFQKPPQFRLFPPMTHFPSFRNGFVELTKSTSTPTLAENTEPVNLMEFSEIPNEDPAHNQNSSFWDVNPVDEILMCTEEDGVDILQPKLVETPSSVKNETRLFPDIENAWGIDEKAIQSWDIVTPISCAVNNTEIPLNNDQSESKPETRDSGTNVEAADYITDGEKVSGCKILTARCRDININSPVKNITPSKKIMIDQSCITDDIDEDGEDEEKRINDLVDLFPNVPRSSLEEIFNKCNKNFHWAVDLLLEDNNLHVTEAREAKKEEKKAEPIVVDSSEDDKEESDAKDAKIFKRKTISEDSLELKKCIESKFDINKEYYSEHVYKVKQTKFGHCEPQTGNIEPQPSTSDCRPSTSDCGPSTSDPRPSTSRSFDSESDDSDDDSSSDPKNMIELNLGEVFVQQLETMFGGNDDAFPKGFQPVVQMPLVLARQIYSFYIESVCQQMETQNHILDRLVREDEEFARKLQHEEIPEEVVRPPTLMEIMDEQVAMKIHKKDVDDWKNLTADNLATKLTKQKLFNTFPNVERDALLEIWHAYDYDFNKTVEDLIASVGPDNVNGSGEAIREPPLSKTTIDEMKEAEETCNNVEEPADEKPATYYREEANKHLKKRAELYEKAKSYFQRGMTEVATFYSELAKKETRSFDKANHFAAAAFIEEHSKRLQKFDTLDLHYFYVKEAIPNLDIFIDRNIMLLKGGVKRGQDLFVITGRGKNSEGGRSKIKPAVIGRLKKRSIGFVELNPGLLKIRVQRDSLITSDLP